MLRLSDLLTEGLRICKILLGVQLGEPAATGRWGAVDWAVDASGKAPALDFFRGLSDRDAAKVEALFRRLADSGRMTNEEKFKKLESRQGLAIWEIKSFQLRFLGGFVPGKRFLVAHAVRKKSDKHRPSDVKKAVRILSEHASRQAEGG